MLRKFVFILSAVVPLGLFIGLLKSTSAPNWRAFCFTFSPFIGVFFYNAILRRFLPRSKIWDDSLSLGLVALMVVYGILYLKDISGGEEGGSLTAWFSLYSPLVFLTTTLISMAAGLFFRKIKLSER